MSVPPLSVSGPSVSADDRAHMAAAIALAARGLGECWPNPSVGCVIVRDGRVVGRGRTAVGGRPHAETEALTAAADAARGATAYVTLEPCSHHGQTPPCTVALIAAGVARVVIGARDPNPAAAGGAELLRQAGIAVETGVLGAAATEVASGFLSRVTRHRPLVTLKLATTLDGRIATRTGQSQWITGVPARRAAHAMRAGHDAIMVGVGTILADDPRLTCRLAGARLAPLVRVIADSHLRTRLTSAILSTARSQPSWFLTRPGADPARVAGVVACGAEVIEVGAGGAGIDLGAALTALAARGITRLLVEGGAHLAAALLRDDLVDRLAWFHAPAVMGGDGYPAARPFGVESLAMMPAFERLASRALGPDMLTMFQRRPD